MACSHCTSSMQTSISGEGPLIDVSRPTSAVRMELGLQHFSISIFYLLQDYIELVYHNFIIPVTMANTSDKNYLKREFGGDKPSCHGDLNRTGGHA